MDYRKLGFYLVCSSPISSVILYLAILPSIAFQASYLTPIIAHTTLNIFTLGFQIAGLVLYLAGDKMDDWTPRHSHLSIGFSIVILMWGIFTILFAAFFYYGALLPWSRELGARPLTVWDPLQHATWGLTGFLGGLSGLLFLVF